MADGKQNFSAEYFFAMADGKQNFSAE